MPELLTVLLTQLQDSSLGAAVRGTEHLYPVLETLHILGIALLVGPAFAFDLLVLGAGRRLVPLTAAGRLLLPLAHLGFAVAIVTGIALLSAQATVVAASAAAPWKLGLLLLAMANVGVFHAGVYRRVHAWMDAAAAPAAARAGALVSMLVWTGVIFAGRFLAYL